MMKISTKEQILFFKDNEIIRFEANGNNTIVWSIDGNSVEINEPIASISKQLKNHGFIRVHQNHLVNVIHISSISSQTHEFIELNNSKLIPINPEQRKIIIQLFSNHLNSQKS